MLDEADRMVDMGFAPDLRRILKLLPRDRQTLMFSATMPPELNSVARESLRNPRRLDLAPPSRPAASIEQAFYPVPRHLKVDLLDEILDRAKDRSVIIFTRTKRGADRLARQLDARGHDVAVIHGDRSQVQRERALAHFKRRRAQVLVATDIASRGIDVDDVTHVINFDVPRTPEDYIHRIGRTGRMNAAGDALTMVTPEDESDVAVIERFLGRRVHRLKLADFDYRRQVEPEHRERRPRGRDAHGPGGRDTGGSRRDEGGSGRRDAPSSRRRDEGRGAAAARREATPSHAPAGRGAEGRQAPAHGRRRRINAPDRRNRRRM